MALHQLMISRELVKDEICKDYFKDRLDAQDHEQKENQL